MSMNLHSRLLDEQEGCAICRFVKPLAEQFKHLASREDESRSPLGWGTAQYRLTDGTREVCVPNSTEEIPE